MAGSLQERFAGLVDGSPHFSFSPKFLFTFTSGFPAGSVVKNLPANAGDMGSMPGLGLSSGEGNGNPLQCSCLGNSMDRGAWQSKVHGGREELDMIVINTR